MRDGKLARVEELTRLPSDVQDTLIGILSEKALPIPELRGEVQARKGFNVIATANNRDRGVNDMSAALLRRFNTVAQCEVVEPPADGGPAPDGGPEPDGGDGPDDGPEPADGSEPSDSFVPTDDDDNSGEGSGCSATGRSPLLVVLLGLTRFAIVQWRARRY
jgi:hypothetical protein